MAKIRKQSFNDIKYILAPATHGSKIPVCYMYPAIISAFKSPDLITFEVPPGFTFASFARWPFKSFSHTPMVGKN